MRFFRQKNKANEVSEPAFIKVGEPTDRYTVSGSVYSYRASSYRTVSITLLAFGYDDAVNRAYKENRIITPTVWKQ